MKSRILVSVLLSAAVVLSVAAQPPKKKGATGAKGYTDEPLLQAVASPSILFDRWARGWPLVECYLAASRFVGWEDVVVGDPLCQRQPAAR